MFKMLALKSSKESQISPNFQANLVKGVNLHHDLYHNNLSWETSEHILERREIGQQYILKWKKLFFKPSTPTYTHNFYIKHYIKQTIQVYYVVSQEMPDNFLNCFFRKKMFIQCEYANNTQTINLKINKLILISD